MVIHIVIRFQISETKQGVVKLAAYVISGG